MGYHILESHQGYYPSLMSPLKTCFSSAGIAKPGIFERLQADTELRLRARLNSSSVVKTYRPREDTPIEDILIRKGKEREIRIRNLMEKEEMRKISELQQKPVINPHSEIIARIKERNCRRGSMSGKGSEGRVSVLTETGKRHEEAERNSTVEQTQNDPGEVKGKTKKMTGSDRHITRMVLNKQQKQLVQELENSYKALRTKKNEDSEKPIGRNYVPMFTKPVDINRLLTSTKKLKNYEFTGTLPRSTKSARNKNGPLVRQISECTVNKSDAHVYQQIIIGRLLKNIKA